MHDSLIRERLVDISQRLACQLTLLVSVVLLYERMRIIHFQHKEHSFPSFKIKNVVTALSKLSRISPCSFL